MSAVQALGAARAFGIRLELDGDDLLLEASAPPPDAVLEALSQHKADVVRILHSAKDQSSPEYWQILFHQRAAFAEFHGGLSRSVAQAQAFECCVVEWLNRNPTPSGAGRCLRCSQPESHGAVVVPYGAEPGTHAWLHTECWPAWQKFRRSQVLEVLTRIGIVCLSDTCSVSGGYSDPPKKHRNSQGCNMSKETIMSLCLGSQVSRDHEVLVPAHTSREATRGVLEESLTVRKEIAIRKEEGLKIDPETAEVNLVFTKYFDRYDVDPDLPEEVQDAREWEYFARSPGSDIWVAFCDLPDEVGEALLQRQKEKARPSEEVDEEIPF
jgi:hypothetical protein